MSAETEPADEDLDGILDRVQSDPALSAGEKQTTITFAAEDDAASAFSEEPALIRRFILHPHIAIDELRILHDDDSVGYLSPEEWNGEAVVGVDARIPVSAITIKSEPRKNDGHAGVVTSAVLQNDPSGGGSI